MGLLGVILVSFIVFAVGGGLGYVIWLRTRPKKQTWTAYVYQLGEGIRKEKLLVEGSEVVKGKALEKSEEESQLQLKDLRPYTRDVLEKVEKKSGETIYQLQKMKKVTPAVEGDTVDYWGPDKKIVHVLFDKGECTLLKKGYDVKAGGEIFEPMPHSKVNLIKSEIITRKQRLKEEKDILQAIAPWIVTGICIIGLVAMTYILGSAGVEMSENLEAASENMAKIKEGGLSDLMDQLEELKSGGKTPEPHELGAQPG